MTSQIVVVDDNEETLETICMMTRNMHIGEVRGFASGEEIISFLKSGEEIGLILCDWNMPEITGLDVLRSLREEGYLTPFIMVTARNDLDSVLEARKSGVDLYISKPFSTEELKQKIQWVHDNHEKRMNELKFKDDSEN